jgi:hypothetical protein
MKVTKIGTEYVDIMIVGPGSSNWAWIFTNHCNSSHLGIMIMIIVLEHQHLNCLDSRAVRTHK